MNQVNQILKGLPSRLLALRDNKQIVFENSVKMKTNQATVYTSENLSL